MNIKWLRTFVVAAQYENFRRAAEALFMAQPTVTVHIQQLEKQVGFELFVRSGKQVKLTTLGNTFFYPCEKKF